MEKADIDGTGASHGASGSKTVSLIVNRAVSGIHHGHEIIRYHVGILTAPEARFCGIIRDDYNHLFNFTGCNGLIQNCINVIDLVCLACTVDSMEQVQCLVPLCIPSVKIAFRQINTECLFCSFQRIGSIAVQEESGMAAIHHCLTIGYGIIFRYLAIVNLCLIAFRIDSGNHTVCLIII